jgi:hypothetical protein
MMVADAALRANAGEDLIRVIKDIQKGKLRKEHLDGTAPAEWLHGVLAKLGTNKRDAASIKDRATARAQLSAAIGSAGTETKLSQRLASLSVGFRAGLDTLFSKNEFAARVLLREMAGDDTMFAAFKNSDAFDTIEKLGQQSAGDRLETIKKAGEDKENDSGFWSRWKKLTTAIKTAAGGKGESNALDDVVTAANQLANSKRKGNAGPFKATAADRARQKSVDAEVQPLSGQPIGAPRVPEKMVRSQVAVEVTVVDKTGAGVEATATAETNDNSDMQLLGRTVNND